MSLVKHAEIWIYFKVGTNGMHQIVRQANVVNKIFQASIFNTSLSTNENQIFKQENSHIYSNNTIEL